METKFFFANVKAIDIENRELEAIASTADVDRDKEIILPSAFAASIGSFKANPVILATHQHRLDNGSSPVIGSAIPESIDISDKFVSFRMKFASTPLGEEYWVLYRDKHMRAFSIGFIPEKWEDSKDSIRTYTQIELLEISAVPVPSNRQALARAKGWFDNAKEDKEIFERLDGRMAELEKQLHQALTIQSAHTLGLDEIKSLITDSAGFAERLLGDSPDSSAPAGEKIAEQLKRIETLFKPQGE